MTSDRGDRPNVREFVRFTVVGVAQNGLNLVVFAVAITVGLPYILASILAAVVALSASFVLNLRWTFPRQTGPARSRAIRFVTIWITILALGLPVLAALVSIAHLPRVLAQAVVILIGAPVSYTSQRRWTFSTVHGRC